MQTIRRFYRDLREYRQYIAFGVKAQLKSEVAGSYLNWLWWIMEPFCFMLIYVFVFGTIFQMSEEYYPIFIFSSNAMWTLFSSMVSEATRLVKLNKDIISQIYVPQFVFLSVHLLTSLFKMFLSFIIVFVMLLVYRVPVTWRIIWLAPVFLVLCLFTFGVCLFFMHWGVYIEDLYYVVQIVLRMLMYFTGIFYSIEKRVAYPYGRILEDCNPVAFLISSMRKILLYDTSPDVFLLAAWGIISLLIIYIGICEVYRGEKKYVKVI